MNDKPVYLDHASTSWPKHPAVSAAIAHTLDACTGTPGRGSHRFAIDAHKAIEHARLMIATLVGADHPDRVVLTSGATDALNTAIFGTLAHRTDRPQVVASVLEHNSVAGPLVALEAEGKIRLTRVSCDDAGRVDPAEFLDAIEPNAALVALTAVSNVVGTVQPLGIVGPAIRDRAPDALFLIDAAQAAGVIPIDVEAWHADLLAFSGHKALRSPTGTGALYISPRAFGSDTKTQPLRPTRFGGTGGSAESPTLPDRAPARFEPGTPNTLGLTGLAAAIENARPNAADERDLLDPFIDLFANDDRVRLLANPKPADQNRAGVLSFNIAGLAPHAAAAVLDSSFGIAVRAGFHCAPWTHERFGTLETGGAVRASVGATSTHDDVDRLARAVRSIIDTC